jgi:hypothetical protein
MYVDIFVCFRGPHVFLVVEDIYIYYMVSPHYIVVRKSGGPQALPGGAQPDPNPLYGGEGLRLER